ncbi:metabotropic glutamate receptor 8-like [Lytechinus variegatus]|uniref:metabotropic glutamate receptor 8-like n=1 Tax=Lytechinus variegatus TaxID=7654 RepID=UPI001BB18941|nr:metabotropic glutamate receptor 8-like [Lytechinus variegatus]
MASDFLLHFYFLVASTFMLLTSAANLSDIATTWPSNHAVRIDGDIIIGGLLRVHQSSDKHVCGQLLQQLGIQSVEAMLYTLDKINNGSILPGFTLGLLAFDDCSHEAYSLEQSVKFVRLDQDLDYIVDPTGAEQPACNMNDSLDDAWRKRRNRGSRVTGVVGASTSWCTVQVANLLKLFKIPQVGKISISLFYIVDLKLLFHEISASMGN